MAISGSGTQADPFIVDNWTDFLTAINTNDAYIKWADSGSKVLSETITVSSEIIVKAKSVDFNGWTFESVYITKQYTSSDTGIFIVQTYTGFTAYNLTVGYLDINDPRHEVVGGRGAALYNVFFDNIKVADIPDSETWWANGQSSTFGGYQDGLFSNCSMYNCILYLHSQNASIIFPKGSYYWCEIYADYKYTLSSARQPVHGLFIRGTRFIRCYVSGKVDVSGGSGSFDIVRAADNSELSGVGVWVDNTILNIETRVSENCTVSRSHIRTFGITGSGKTFFVTNNGNNYNAYNNTITEVVKGLLSDLRNSDELTIEGVIFMEDDETRYPQYASDNSTKDWTFRKSVNVNTGIPFLPFWKYPTSQPPTPTGGEVYENPYLTVYDMETKQDEFDNHGLAILCPTSGRIVEELNGEYSLSFTHPRDTDNKWQYVLEMNVVKALGQLFVIQKVDETQSGGSGYVSAYAEHITYTLNDKWIFPPVTIAGYSGQTLIDSIMEQATDLGYDWQTTYDFDITTNLNAPEGFRDWYEMSEGVTPYEMLIGGNGFVAKLGGELYRDNFHMSINSRMEGARDNAFELAIGYNLTGIKRTVDLTTFCTYLRGYDVTDGTYDNWFAIGWDPSTLPRPYPREVVRSTNFFYEHPEYAEEGQLERDTSLFFNQNCAPLVSYELNVVDLRRNPDYKMFSNNYRFKVGDKGRVWDERLQAWLELEITRTEHDIITGDCVKVVIGTQRSFTRPVGYQPVIPRGIIIPAAEKVLEGVVPLYFNSAADKLIDWTIYGASGGVGNTEYGSNLFDFESWYSGVYDVQNGTVSWDRDNQAFTLTAAAQDCFTYPYATDYMYSYAYKIPVEASTKYELSWSANNDNQGNVYIFRNGITSDNAWISNANGKALVFDTNADTTEITLRFGVLNSGESITYSNIKLRKVTTTIPVIVSQSEPVYYATGNDDRYATPEGAYRLEDDMQTQTVSILIDHPLEEGKSISLADTGIDIPTYIGDNTLDVDTTVKPRVKITYKEG